MRSVIVAVGTLSVIAGVLVFHETRRPAALLTLPTSKQLGPVPGTLGKLNSFPATMVVSPDGRYAALLHAGYGTQQARGRQSISIVDLEKNQVMDFPDDRLSEDAHQSYFVGIVFSGDGRHLYASLGSLTDPTGENAGDTG